MNQYIGKLLDNRYEILDVIGVGGMAVVYKALCHRLNRLVAVKILKDEFLGDEEFRRRFRAEGEAVAMLSHPNIVQVFDVSTSANAYYIVMELIDGISLKQYMHSKGVLNWKETLHFASQIAKGLEHAHSRGIVHRDIKPHNVMVLKNGSVKVMDFGIAQVMNKSSTLTKEALGSVHYISPEQAKGSYTDSRSDIYSLGVVMYEMMTGRPPYDGDSPVAVAIKHISGGAALPTTLNPNIPAGLEQIIMRCMALDARDRYSTATELLADLEEFRKNSAVTFQYSSVMDDSTRALKPITDMDISALEQTARRNSGRILTNSGRVLTNSQVLHLNPNKNAKRSGSDSGTDSLPARSQDAIDRIRERRREEERREAERTRVGTIAVVACSVVAVIAIVVFLVAIFNGALVNQERELVEVPYLVGDLYAEDFAERYPNFTLRLQPQQYDDFYVMGQIMRQEPVGGSKVNKGTEIFLTISMGTEPKVKLMEDLVGVTQDRATSFLIGQSLKTLIREEPSDVYPAGCIIRTEPAADAELTDGQTVKLWVSTGPDQSLSKMPNVLEMNKDVALQVLESHGFKNVSTPRVHSSKNVGDVVSQSHAANALIDVTTHIVLEISDGPEVQTRVMPEVIRVTYEAAESTLRDMGFTNITNYPIPASDPQGTVVTQSVQADTEITLDTEIKLGVSTGNGQVSALPTAPAGTEYVTFNVPQRTEAYTLMLCRKDHPELQIASGTIYPGKTTFTVELADSGVQEYDMYINGEKYQSMKVTFRNNG